jgi:hypothetical protein
MKPELGPAPGDLPEAAEELVERVVLGELRHPLATADRLRDVDRHDGRSLLFVQVGEVRQRRGATLAERGDGEGGHEADNEKLKCGERPAD